MAKLKLVSSSPKVNRSLANYIPERVVLKAQDVNNVGKVYLQTISNSKKELMALYPTVSNDVYNQLAKLAYGIFGQESSFGTFGGVRGAYGNLRDQVATRVFDYNSSVGVTQIRLSSVNQQTRDAFDINSVEDIRDNVVKSAQATMSLLLDIYVNEIPNTQKGNFYNLIPLAYSNRTEFNKALKEGMPSNLYVKNVHDYADLVNVYVSKDRAPSLSANTNFTLPEAEVETDSDSKFLLSADKELGEEIDKTYADELFAFMNPRAKRKTYLKKLRDVIIRFFTGLAPRTKDEHDTYKILNIHHIKRMAGEEALSFYQKGVLYLLGNETGGTYDRALMHEQWHRFTQGILSEKDREDLYRSFLIANPNLRHLTNRQLEEHLAEMFASYAVNRIRAGGFSLSQKVRRIFSRLLRLFNFISRDFSDINNVFEKVMIGYYGGVYKRDNSEISKLNLNTRAAERYFQGKDAEQRYNIAFKWVASTIHKYSDRHERAQNLYDYYGPEAGKSLEYYEDGLVSYTPEEAVKMAYQELLSMAEKGYYVDPDSGATIDVLGDFRKANEQYEKLEEKIREALASGKYTKKQTQALIELKDSKWPQIQEARFKNASIQGIVNSKIFSHFVSHLYPVDAFSFDIEKIYENRLIHDEYDTEEEIIDADEVFNIEQETADKDTYNLRSGTTSQIKLALSRIFLDNEKTDLIPYPKANAVAIDVLKNVKVNATNKEVRDYLLQQKKTKYAGDPRARRVIDHIILRYALANKPQDTHINFYNDDIVMAYDLNKTVRDEDYLRHVPLSKSEVEKRGIRLFKKRPNEMQPQFVERIAVELSKRGVPYDEVFKRVSDSYENFRHKEFTADIAFSVQSLEEKNKLIGEKNWWFNRNLGRSILSRKWIRGNEDYNSEIYLHAAARAISSTLKAEIHEARQKAKEEGVKDFDKRKIQLRRLDYFYKPEKKAGKKENENVTRYRAIISYFNYLGLPKKFEEALPIDPTDNSVYILYKQLEADISYLNTAFKEQEQKGFNVDDAVNSEYQVLRRFAQLPASQDEFARNTTFISGDNKRKWKAKRSSFWGDVMRSFRIGKET
jgi:hypothetical protein